MQWVKLRRGGFTALNKSYSFQWNEKTFVLARMRVSEAGVGVSRLLRHYKVVEKDGEVVATYVSEETGGTRGT